MSIASRPFKVHGSKFKGIGSERFDHDIYLLAYWHGMKYLREFAIQVSEKLFTVLSSQLG
jgi:hypothetical protein